MVNICIAVMIAIHGQQGSRMLGATAASLRTCPLQLKLCATRSRLRLVLASTSGAGISAAGDDGDAADAAARRLQGNDAVNSDSTTTSNGVKPGGFIDLVKSWVEASKVDKQKLAEYGLGAFAAYGIISNLNAGVLMTLAWLAVVKRTGVSPIEGQWPAFLAMYAGLWVGASFMRPIRLSLALAAAPLVNVFLEATQKRLGVNKGVAFGLLLAMIAAGSFTVIFGTIALLGGFPNGIPQLGWAR